MFLCLRLPRQGFHRKTTKMRGIGAPSLGTQQMGCLGPQVLMLGHTQPSNCQHLPTPCSSLASPLPARRGNWRERGEAAESIAGDAVPPRARPAIVSVCLQVVLSQDFLQPSAELSRQAGFVLLIIYIIRYIHIKKQSSSRLEWQAENESNKQAPHSFPLLSPPFCPSELTLHLHLLENIPPVRWTADERQSSQLPCPGWRRALA